MSSAERLITRWIDTAPNLFCENGFLAMVKRICTFLHNSVCYIELA